MAKKRKTREQKKLADSRHTFKHVFVGQETSAVKPQASPVSTISLSYKPKPSISTNQYPYLIKDLSKTGVLTLGILALQIILFSLIRIHVLTIPGISY
jgi:hypothetical protein